MPEVSWSKIKLWRRCPKAYDYKHNQRLVRRKKAAPLLRGEIVGAMLDARAVKKDPWEVLATYAEKYKALFREEREMYGDLIEDLTRIMQGYFDTYEDDDLEYEGVEEFVATDLTGDIRFVGYIDKIAIDKKTKRRWILDHKSHKNIPGDEQRASDLQLVFYIWAWNRWNKSRPVDGILWDYIRTKPPAIPEVLKNGTLSKRENIDTTYAIYRDEVLKQGLKLADYKDILESLKKRGSEKFYKRVKLPSPPQSMVESVVEDARQTAVMIARLSKSFTPRNLTRDCSFCEYYQLCQAELRGLDAAFIKKAEFETKEPNEHARQEDED